MFVWVTVKLIRISIIRWYYVDSQNLWEYHLASYFNRGMSRRTYTHSFLTCRTSLERSVVVRGWTHLEFEWPWSQENNVPFGYFILNLFERSFEYFVFQWEFLHQWQRHQHASLRRWSFCVCFRYKASYQILTSWSCGEDILWCLNAMLLRFLSNHLVSRFEHLTWPCYNPVLCVNHASSI